MAMKNFFTAFIICCGLFAVSLLVVNATKAQSQSTSDIVYEYRFLELGHLHLPGRSLDTVQDNEDYRKSLYSYDMNNVYPELRKLSKEGWRLHSAIQIYSAPSVTMIFVREIRASQIGDTSGTSGANTDLVGDLDNDGDVDFQDFLVFVKNFGSTVSG